MSSCHDHAHVPSLESSAFTVFFDKVLCMTTRDTVDIVRDILDQQRTLIRERWAKDLYERMLSQQQWHHPDIFAFVDCILDSEFKSLQVCVPIFPISKSFAGLMAIITHRCPNLEHLEVSFPVSSLLQTKSTFCLNQNELYIIQPGSLLPSLKSLKLNFTGTWSWLSVPYYTRILQFDDSHSLLSIVGKLCPVLTKLEVTRADFTRKRDIVALIVNAEMTDVLFPKDGHPWSQNSDFSSLRIPLQFLNPLCLTLKELILDSRKLEALKSVCESVYAFALRHLPQLEKIGVEPYLKPIEILKLLYQAMDTYDQKPFEEAWRKAASRLGLDVASPVTFFPDTLSLKKLYVPTNDLSSYLAVSRLCPTIVEVSFMGPRFRRSCNDSISSILKKNMESWSNVESVKILSMDQEFVMMVLDTFGPNLKKLMLSGIGWDVDMAHLASICTNLEHLTLFDARINHDFEAACGWTPDTFFPKLTHFQSNNSYSKCLGVWGVLIEKKSTLVHLSLQCCHIGTKAHRYKADSPRLEWSQLPQLWSQLESLEIGNCTGLTMAILADIIPRFAKLRCIAFPSSLLKEDRVLIRKIMEEKGVEIKNYRFSFGNFACPFRYWI